MKKHLVCYSNLSHTESFIFTINMMKKIHYKYKSVKLNNRNIKSVKQIFGSQLKIYFDHLLSSKVKDDYKSLTATLHFYTLLSGKRYCCIFSRPSCKVIGSVSWSDVVQLSGVQVASGKQQMGGEQHADKLSV